MPWISVLDSNRKGHDLFKQETDYDCGVAAAATAVWICKSQKFSAQDILQSAEKAEPEQFHEHMKGKKPAGMNMDLIRGSLRMLGINVKDGKDDETGPLPWLDKVRSFQKYSCVVMLVEQEGTDLTHFVVIGPGESGPVVLCPSGKVFGNLNFAGEAPSYLSLGGHCFFTADYIAVK